MRMPNPELEKMIREKTLALLLEKEPEEIGMRDIARACEVSPTTIYYYYADKDALFEAVKLDCLGSMDNAIHTRAVQGQSPIDRLRGGISGFRDWAFDHPRIALLVMGRLKPNISASDEEMARYYRSNDFAKILLDDAVKAGAVNCADTKLSSALVIAGVWGAIESILLNRSDPVYWDRGIFFTDAMIDRCIASLQ